MATQIHLLRHGETAWSLSGQHTGRADLPLTENGERRASQLRERLRGITFTHVVTSPLQRARQTCELAGFGTVARLGVLPVGSAGPKSALDLSRKRN